MAARPAQRQTEGRSMGYWVTQAAKRERERAGVMRVQIAALLHKYESAITRFEQEWNIPAEIDRYLAAYAEACGVDDSRDIWRKALELWKKHGAPPLLNPADDAAAATANVERAIGEQIQRDGPAQSSPARESSASRKKRKAG